MTALNTSVGHPTGISRQYMMPTTIYYPAASRGSIFLQWRLPNKQEGVQTIENQTILVGGVQWSTPNYTPNSAYTPLLGFSLAQKFIPLPHLH